MLQGGAPRKNTHPTKQLLVTEEEESLFYELPGAKKRKTTRRNDLMEAVSVNDGRGPNKKH